MYLHWFLCNVLWLLVWWVFETLSVGSRVSLTLSCALRACFLLFCCLLQHWYEALSLVLVYLVLLCLLVVSWRPTLFWKEAEWKRFSGKGEVRGHWEKWREGKLCSECITWEKNLFSIKNVYFHNLKAWSSLLFMDKMDVCYWAHLNR